MRKIYILLYSILVVNTSLYSAYLMTFPPASCSTGYASVTPTTYFASSDSCDIYYGSNSSSYGGEGYEVCVGDDGKADAVRNLTTRAIYSMSYSCVASPIPECDVGEIYSEELEICVPDCPDPYILDENATSCVLPPDLDPDLDPDEDGLPNDCDPDSLNYDTFDCDDDGIPNGTDTDDDGDGIPDSSDTTQGGSSEGCQGENIETRRYYGITGYNPYDYEYYGITYGTCKSQFIDTITIYDSVMVFDDLEPSCEREYCYRHTPTPSCNYSADEYAPSGINWQYFSQFKTYSDCESNLNLDISTDFYFTQPNAISCPTVGFCYYNFKDSSTDTTVTNSENNDSTMDNDLDLNSTTTDLQPLLQASNTTNKHLQDLKDKTDLTNDKLDELKGTARDNLNTNKSQLDELKSMNDTLDNFRNSNLNSLSSINDGIDSTNSNLRTLNTTLSGASGTLDNINQNIISSQQLDSDPFTEDIFNDGLSDGIGGFETDIKGQYNGFIYTNLLGFANQSHTLPTVTFNMWGHTFTALEPSMFDSFPIDTIRALMLFIFAIAGFITVFKGGA